MLPLLPLLLLLLDPPVLLFADDDEDEEEDEDDDPLEGRSLPPPPLPLPPKPDALPLVTIGEGTRAWTSCDKYIREGSYL